MLNAWLALQDYVDDIRAMYTRDWSSKDPFKQQMGVALYFIDKLALRAGHEKDDDEADTVGCCTLKVKLIFAFSHRSYSELGLILLGPLLIVCVYLLALCRRR